MIRMGRDISWPLFIEFIYTMDRLDLLDYQTWYSELVVQPVADSIILDAPGSSYYRVE